MFDPRGLIDVVIVLVAVLLFAPFFGRYLGQVFTDRPAFGDRFWNPIENAIFRLIGTNPRHSMRFKEYTIALLVTSAAVLIWIFAVVTLQASLPFNPGGIPGMSWDLALHTASSFTTNTDFTHYTAESQLSLGGAILGLQIALFLSAGTGLAVVVAFIRGFTRQDGTLGNFYVDLVRAVTRVLLPLSVVAALVLIALGLPQTFTSSVNAYPMTGGVQTIYLGPVASWTSIEMIGSNGGGWYAANAANALANPSVLSMLFQTGLMLLIPFSIPFMFGRMVRKPNEANPYIATILIVFLAALGLFMYFQYVGNPALGAIPGLTISGNYTVGQQSLGTLPETSFFQISSIYGNIGAQNMALGSITPGAQLVSFFGMFTQSTPGGVGTGFGTLLVFALVAVFIGGLMVGRTPEYLGKKVGKDQMRWSAFLLVSHPTVILVPVVIAFAAGFAGPGVGAVGPNLAVNAHQFTILLYEFTSEATNNGSAMGPITDNTVFFNLAGSAVMLVGRFFPMIAMLAIGSLFAKEEPIPVSAGTLQTNSTTFTLYLTLMLIIISGLLFLPVLALGPLAQIGGWRMMEPTLEEIAASSAAAASPAPRQVAHTSWSRVLTDSLRYFDPRRESRHPVMFVVWIFMVFLAVLTVFPRAFPDVAAGYNAGYYFALTVILFLTLWFGHLSEAIAEARGRAQAESLRQIRSGMRARQRLPDGTTRWVPSDALHVGDLVVIEASEVVPMDGDVIEGAALIDESMMTGESAPAVRESGGDRTSVLGGTRIIQGTVTVRISASVGHSFLDRLISLVENAGRESTPNELALGVLLASLTAVLLVIIVTFADVAGSTGVVTIDIATMLALFVALMPTTIGALLPAIGISGINRVAKANVIAKSGTAVEAAGDLDVLILDKTGTITVGNRLAIQFIPSPQVEAPELLSAALLCSSLDDTPEGRSIVRLAARRGATAPRLEPGSYQVLVFTAERRMSGLTLKDGREIFKGSIDAMEAYGAVMPPELRDSAREQSRLGMTPLIISVDHRALGLVVLKDVVKPGIRDRIHELKTMGIRTIMCTGDNRITAAAIARESGVDEFIAEAKPETKLQIIEREKALGRLVAMSGDGSNDAPALARADVGLAMNSGTSAAKEAGNMVDLDNDPTKLIEIVSIGKQLLITRGALTTFTITNDVAKYFAILPAIFVTASGAAIAGVAQLNVLGLDNPSIAVISTLFFNAIVIPLLIPLALFGVGFRPRPAIDLLRRNLIIYGVGGLISAFVGIWLIYQLFVWAATTPLVGAIATALSHVLPLGGL